MPGLSSRRVHSCPSVREARAETSFHIRGDRSDTSHTPDVASRVLRLKPSPPPLAAARKATALPVVPCEITTKMPVPSHARGACWIIATYPDSPLHLPPMGSQVAGGHSRSSGTNV